MPLILNQYQSTYRLALWSLSEPLSFFEDKAKLSTSDKAAYLQIRNESRKKEWLAVRCLLNETLGFWPQITYAETGKPILQNHTRYLSISHSRSMVGILLCTSPHAGLDIEHIERNIEKVANRFLAESERNYLEQYSGKNGRILYWCAKEAIYKAVNETNIKFSEKIIIKQVNNDNTLDASFTSGPKKIDFLMSFVELDNHFIVWTTGL